MKKKTRAPKKSTSKQKTPTPRSPRAAWTVATSARRPAAERIAAFAEAPLAVDESDSNLQAILNTLRDEKEPIKVRLAALQSLQAASFSAVTYPSWRSDYIATLRTVAEDPDPEMRQRALGILAREKDGFAQKKLLEGLQNPDKALLTPEKALQLLSYDVHSEAYTVARKIANDPPNPTARREALRLLAADAGSAPVFERVLRDKSESPEIRQISAAALQALKPERLQLYAREAVLDPSEHDDMRATSLTALTQFGNAETIASDKALLKRVDKLSGEAPTKVKQGARRFLSKYGK